MRLFEAISSVLFLSLSFIDLSMLFENQEQKQDKAVYTQQTVHFCIIESFSLCTSVYLSYICVCVSFCIVFSGSSAGDINSCTTVIKEAVSIYLTNAISLFLCKS